MIKKPITIQISNGLEARPIAMLEQVASQFESEIYVESGNKKVNAEKHYGHDDSRAGRRRQRDHFGERCGQREGNESD